MYIFDKNNIPKEIVDDDERFYVTIYLMIRQNHLKAEEFDDYMKKYHKDTKIFDMIENYPYLRNYFDDLDERKVKALNSPYLRYYLKNLKKSLSFQKLSQNNAKKFVANFICEIIQECCFLTYQNIFKEKYMDLFEQSVQDEHLKKEFDQFVVRILRPLSDGIQFDLSDKAYAFVQLYRQAHAKYLIELLSDDCDQEKLKFYKKEVHDVLEMSFEDAFKKYNVYLRQMENLTLESKKSLEELIDREIDETPRMRQLIEEKEKVEAEIYEKAKETLQTNILTPISEEDIQDYVHSINEEALKEEYYDEFDDRDLSRYKKIYRKYFQCDEDYFDDYFESIDHLTRFLPVARQVQSIHIHYYLVTLFCTNEDYNVESQAHKLLSIEKDVDQAFEKTCDFLNILAYYLWHKQDVFQREKRIREFEKIKSDIPECYETFLNLRDENGDRKDKYESMTFHFTPRDTYYNHVVLSVLLNIDESYIARKVKRIILSDHNNEYDLSKESLKMTSLYEKGMNDENMYLCNDFADLFMMSYIKDRDYIASYSPLVRHFRDISVIYELSLGPYEEIIESCLHHTYEDDPHLQNKINMISKQYNELIRKYNENKEVLKLTEYYELNSLFWIMRKTRDIYNQLEDIHTLFEKYRYQMIWYLSVFCDNEQFFNLSLEKQVSKFLSLCLIFQLVDEIDNYEIYMPHKQSIEQNEYIESLKRTIDDHKHIIEIKDQQLEDVKVQKEKQTKHQKDKTQKLLEEELKYYKQEVSSLNKQLNQKDQEMILMQQNQQELFKLRELMFEMQEDEKEREDLSFDLKPLLKDKTIVTIGGHIHLRDKLKQKYPSLKILSESSHVTDAVLLNADHVFMFHKFMTHDMYNRAVSVLVRNNIPWDYIPYTNLEKSEKVMFDILSQNE